MTRQTLRAVGVGPVLDRSFQVYRKLFSPLFLITLLAFGPVYLLSNLLVVNLGALPVIPEFRFDDMDRFWMSRVPGNWLEGGLPAVWKVSGMVLVVLALLFVIVPVYIACAVILTKRTLDGDTPTVGSALKEAWRRYGRVLGNGLLFMLITIGSYMGISMANMVLSLLYGGAVLSTAALANSSVIQAAAGGFVLVFYFFVFYGGSLAYYFLIIRFGYFLPPLLFEDEGVGLGRSWSLTRKSFWRLLALYMNLGTLAYVFAIVLGVVFAGFGVSVAGLLLMLFAFCALIPVWLVVYTVSYRAQKIRTDADDLEALLRRLKGPEAETGGVGP